MKNLFALAGIITGAGLIVISSVSRDLFMLQLIWAAIGVGMFFALARIDWRSLISHRWIIWGAYALVSGLLLVTFVSAPTIRNVRSWLVLGPISVQPVELAKVTLILVYARYFSRRHLAVARWKHIATSFLIFAIPAGLTFLQPDLGSALILFGIWFGFLLASGLPRRRLVLALAVFAVAGLIGWNFFLEDYQKDRIRGVFYPTEDALTVNYSVIQSKIAIGSAGWWGKGYGQGTQTRLGFLPEPANDFVFAALVEEWGLMGGLFIAGIFLLLVLQILKVGTAAGQNFEKFICLGTAIMFLLHFSVNTGSALGIFPVVGVTFPFLSYGGSSLLTDFFLLAIIYAIAK